VWRSLVAHFLREEGVGGSNPLTPTNILQYRQCLAQSAADHFIRTALSADHMVRRFFVYLPLSMGGATDHSSHPVCIVLVGLVGVLDV
jgi:hypothetical protein